MAFENVFGNINYSQIAQARQMDANRLQNAIGQGIAQYNKGQDRKLQARQLGIQEQERVDKANEFDLKRVGQQALWELSQGYEKTPERVASAKAYSAIQQVAFNPISGEQAPSALQRVMGGGQAPQQTTQSQYQGISPEQQIQRDAAIARNIARVGGQAPTMDPAPQIPVAGGSPKTRQAAEEANIELQKEAASNKIEESKKQREFMLKKQRNRPQQERALYGAAQEWSNIDNEINKAIDQTSNWTAGMGSYLSMVAGTPAKDLQSTLDTITGDAAFTKLIELKANGGTLGAISKSELDLLKAAVKNIQADQSPSQLKENLIAYAALRKQSLARVAQGYKDEYGDIPEDISKILAVEAPNETQDSVPAKQSGWSIKLKGN